MSEFRNHPLPGDWTFPKEVEEKLDPIAAAVLSEREFNGMPIPLAFKITHDNNELFRRVGHGDIQASQELLQIIAETEKRYPDSSAWDNLRSYLALQLTEADKPEAALAAINCIQEPHRYLDALFGFGERTDADPDLIASIAKDPDEQRKGELFRALRDRMIDQGDIDDDGPFSIISNHLLVAGYETDLIAGWAESQSKTLPNVNWPETIELVRNDRHWGDVPNPWRQYMMMSMLCFEEQLRHDEDTPELGDGFIGFMDDWRLKHPGVEIWDYLTASSAVSATTAGHELTSVKLVDSIIDERYKVSVALALIKQDKAEAARGLAIRMKDYHLGAELLLYGPWDEDDDEPLVLLQNIITKEEYPTPQRIGFMQYIRNQMIEQGDSDGAVRYDNMIADLENN